MKKRTAAMGHDAEQVGLEERLGMNRKIPRRDFLNGAAIGFTGALGALNGFALDPDQKMSDSVDSENYPPLRSGLRGQYPAAVAEFDSIRSGKYTELALNNAQISEDYDLVIVGGGISGLSAAHFYR